MIMDVVRIVPSTADRNMGIVNVLLNAANPIAATTPREAASVGVATPA